MALVCLFIYVFLFSSQTAQLDIVHTSSCSNSGISENIKLLGIGLYCPHDNVAVMNGVVKIIEGQSFYGKVIQEENAEIPVSTNQLNPSTKIKFSKSITCKKN